MLCAFNNVQLRWPHIAPWIYLVSDQSLPKASVQFSVKSGDLVWLRGANGVGKTTWMRMVAGLLPMSGDISWCAPIARRELVHGFFRPFLPSLDEYVQCDLMVAQEFLRRMQSPIQPALLDKLLCRFGLLAVRYYPVHALSSGQRLRLSLVPLCYTQYSIWLLDEPFAHLDDVACQLVRSLMSTHRARGGVVFLASHFVEELVDKTIELSRSHV